MIWFFRLWVASVLAAVGFPKVLITERIWPIKPDDMVWEPDLPWSHNIKDDLTDWIKRDKEWWMKFFCFMVYLEGFIIIGLVIVGV